MSSKVVLDASALLCLLNDEPGADRVVDVLTRSIIGTTNLAEVVSKLRDRGLPLDEVREADLLLQGHMHHMQFSEDGDRKWICVPAMESGSTWWRDSTGTWGSPGILTFKTKDGRIRDMTKIEATPEHKSN